MTCGHCYHSSSFTETTKLYETTIMSANTEQYVTSIPSPDIFPNLYQYHMYLWY